MSEQQQATLDFIRGFTEKHGYAPSEVEIAREFGISQQAVGLRIDTLVRRGDVRRTVGVHRSITLVE